MVTLPRLLFFEKTRVRVEFERGYKFSYLLVHDASSVSIKKIKTTELPRDHYERFCDRPIDPNGVEKAIRMMLGCFYITDRAKEKLKELLMEFEIEKAEESVINAACVKLAASIIDPKSALVKIPKRFRTRELALERYNALKMAIADQQAADADNKPEDTEADVKKSATSEPKAAKVRKVKQSKPPKEEPKMATKPKKKVTKPAPIKTKKVKTGKDRKPYTRMDPDAKFKARVSIDEVVIHKDSNSGKLLKKIIAAGARGITLKTLGGDKVKPEIRTLIAQERIAIMK